MKRHVMVPEARGCIKAFLALLATAPGDLVTCGDVRLLPNRRFAVCNGALLLLGELVRRPHALVDGSIDLCLELRGGPRELRELQARGKLRIPPREQRRRL